MRTRDEWLRELREDYRVLRRASAARQALPAGSSRARVTSANARWSSAAEEFARTCDKVTEAGMPELIRVVQEEP